MANKPPKSNHTPRLSSSQLEDPELLRSTYNKIASKYVIPTIGKVYEIFECDHIFDHPTYSTKWRKGSNIKVCPICNASFLYKYRICPTCNTEIIGKKLRVGNGCKFCGYGQLDSSFKLFCKFHPDLVPRFTTSEKAMQSSIDAYDCLHRESCLTKYISYNVLPCLDCSKYEPSKIKYVQAKHIGILNQIISTKDATKQICPMCGEITYPTRDQPPTQGNPVALGDSTTFDGLQTFVKYKYCNKCKTRIIKRKLGDDTLFEFGIG